MEILDVSFEDYCKIVKNPFCLFEDANFAKLNENKVDKVKYFIFNNGKNRFGLIGGLKANVLKFPFSASFSALSEITSKNRIEYYIETFNSLISWAKENSIQKIIFNTPPVYYDISHISKMQNALLTCGFNQSEYNLNFEFYLKDFDENYLSMYLKAVIDKNLNVHHRELQVYRRTPSTIIKPIINSLKKTDYIIIVDYIF